MYDEISDKYGILVAPTIEKGKAIYERMIRNLENVIKNVGTA